MEASTPSRLILLLVAAVVFAFANISNALLILVPTFCLYVVVGERSLLKRFIRPLTFILLVSAALWVFVGIDLNAPDYAAAIAELGVEDAPFLLLLRTAVASTIVVLAVAAAKDGALLGVAKSFRLGDNAAILLVAAMSLVWTIRESFDRSVVALRAHGLISQKRSSVIRHLPSVLGLTWAASLDLAMRRAQNKWEDNRFLHPGSQVFSLRGQANSRHDLACAIFSGVVLLLIVVVR